MCPPVRDYEFSYRGEVRGKKYEINRKREERGKKRNKDGEGERCQ
jgi:hypothetical protein